MQSGCEQLPTNWIRRRHYSVRCANRKSCRAHAATIGKGKRKTLHTNTTIASDFHTKNIMMGGRLSIITSVVGHCWWWSVHLCDNCDRAGAREVSIDGITKYIRLSRVCSVHRINALAPKQTKRTTTRKTTPRKSRNRSKALCYVFSVSIVLVPRTSRAFLESFVVAQSESQLSNLHQSKTAIAWFACSRRGVCKAMLDLQRHENCPIWRDVLSQQPIPWTGLRYTCLKVLQAYCKVFDQLELYDLIVRYWDVFICFVCFVCNLCFLFYKSLNEPLIRQVYISVWLWLSESEPLNFSIKLPSKCCTNPLQSNYARF